MEFVEVNNLVKRYGREERPAVDGVSFGIKKGQLLTLLGPSGCGKTTTLRCIAGLEMPDAGDIWIDGEPVTSIERGIMVPPDRRNLGMVFQSYAIWPHMTVFDNVAYGLQVRRAPLEEINFRVAEVLKMVGLAGLEQRNATMLSGGQQQRVAIARAMVYNPRVLLFDEPLSNLDAKLREAMRVELVRIQREVGITAIYVTHDQQEAMVISDEVIVMRAGRIEQRGGPRIVYKQPRNRFVAGFIGAANLIEGRLVGRSGGIYCTVEVADQVISGSTVVDVALDEAVVVCLRPETLRISRERPVTDGNILSGQLVQTLYRGGCVDYHVRVGEGMLQVECLEDLGIVEGELVFLYVKRDDCLCLPA